VAVIEFANDLPFQVLKYRVNTYRRLIFITGIGRKKVMSENAACSQKQKATEVDELVACNNPMVIASSYKGIVLTQPVCVQSIVPGKVTFQAPEQGLCFTLKEKVQFYSSVSREIVSARVLECNGTKGLLELADLTFTGRCWKERQNDRVQPRDPIYVHVEHKRALVRANLENLSTGGMSLMGCTYRENALHLDHDTAVRLTLQLPGDDDRMNLKGRVVHARQIGSLVIVGVQLVAHSAQEKRISQYVKARKIEILAELEKISRAICEQPWMLPLYA
jgi:hypothetical protein